MPEFLPGIYIGQVDLHRRQTHRLQGVQNGHAGVGIGGGVDDDAVHLPVGPLDLVHNGPLVVGLEQLHLSAALVCRLADKGLQGSKVLLAIDIGLPNAQHVQVWAVNHQQLHSITLLIISSTVSSTVPLLSTVTWAMAS